MKPFYLLAAFMVALPTHALAGDAGRHTASASLGIAAPEEPLRVGSLGCSSQRSELLQQGRRLTLEPAAFASKLAKSDDEIPLAPLVPPPEKEEEELAEEIPEVEEAPEPEEPQPEAIAAPPAFVPPTPDPTPEKKEEKPGLLGRWWFWAAVTGAAAAAGTVAYTGTRQDPDIVLPRGSLGVVDTR